jgi:pimeloyl-ACP methyl ester carboxylesterase
MAFARQAWLLPRDTRAPVIPRARDGEDVVVLMHGLFASAGVLRPLRSALEAIGVHTAALSYAPGPGVEELSRRLGELTSELPKRARLHLIGHSLGGIVTRFYAIDRGDDRVVQTISLASPFAGISTAGVLAHGLFEGVRDITPASPVLRRLRLEPGPLHLSVIAGADTVVTPPLAHALPSGEVQVFERSGHNALLFDDDVTFAVAKRIASMRATTERAAAR